MMRIKLYYVQNLKEYRTMLRSGSGVSSVSHNIMALDNSIRLSSHINKNPYV